MGWFWGGKKSEDDEWESYTDESEEGEFYSDEEEGSYDSEEEYNDDQDHSESRSKMDQHVETGVKQASNVDVKESLTFPAQTPMREAVDKGAKLDKFLASKDTSFHQLFNDDMRKETVEPKPSTGDASNENSSSLVVEESMSEETYDEDSIHSSDDDDSSASSEASDLSMSEAMDDPIHASIASPSSPTKRDIEQENSLRNLPSDDDDSSDDSDDDDEDEKVTSFVEKQSLLMLAAEHDRVDILNSILTDDHDEKEWLLNSGIPPLHMAISFGSTNACTSLLRMGANPSLRPDVASIQKEMEAAPKESRVEIANPSKFDGASAWELAFGSANYDPAQFKRKSWLGFGESQNNGEQEASQTRMIAPVDIKPSKREGIRHAFTAESLRCIGADEVGRLKELLESGMPPSIDIGGKDLYGWAIEMGALQCEELLRPTEAAKYSSPDQASPVVENDLNPMDVSNDSGHRSFRVLDRSKPGEAASIASLLNKLDESESLAGALSTCLDNLAEEVSVCHGLLLMEGGASALAAHVKSLKVLQSQKQDQLVVVREEWGHLDDELVYLIDSIGDGLDQTQLDRQLKSKSLHLHRDSFRKFESKEEEDSQRSQLLAQIGASENKIRKLRVSIADLSDESTREMAEVEKRGLTGGINLVRGLRETIREIDFELSEAKNAVATCRAKIGMIRTKQPDSKRQEAGENKGNIPDSKAEETAQDRQSTGEPASESPILEKGAVDAKETSPPISPGNSITEKESLEQQTTALARVIRASNKRESEKIASGESQALVVRPPGNRGYFRLDLWQVILRIIGLDRAATRRGIEVSKQRAHEPSQFPAPKVMVL